MNPPQTRPRIGITMGDPAGIGPEILVKALQNEEIYGICRPVVIGDLRIMEEAVSMLNSPMALLPIDDLRHFSDRTGTINLLPASRLTADAARLESPSSETGKAMESYILKGVEMALADRIGALVTAPITKTGLKMAGSRFHGHTELIAHHTQTDRFAMMMAGQRLKVVLTTIHIPLARVPEFLTRERILEIIRLTYHSLVDRFGIPRPRIAVAGLNPHAGEDAMFGREEQEIIDPALDAAREKGIDVTGPLPPDTVFHHAVQGRFHAVVCMYHDQGLIPFKLIHFKDGVNTTLGLPIIRTSVDHGTAYDIAWTGKADDTSLREAVKMAALQARNMQRPRNAQ